MSFRLENQTLAMKLLHLQSQRRSYLNQRLALDEPAKYQLFNHSNLESVLIDTLLYLTSSKPQLQYQEPQIQTQIVEGTYTHKTDLLTFPSNRIEPTKP
jgi:hypothetical protein